MSVYCNMPENEKPESERNLPSETDRDMLLIIALLFILIKDGGDMELILALGYILL